MGDLYTFLYTQRCAKRAYRAACSAARVRAVANERSYKEENDELSISGEDAIVVNDDGVVMRRALTCLN